MKEALKTSQNKGAKTERRSVNQAYLVGGILALALMGAVFIGYLMQPQIIEFPPETIERMINESVKNALQETKRDIEHSVDEAFDPSYDAVSDYTDFHYSLKGQYVELYKFLTKGLEAEIQRWLFEGIEARLDRAFFDSNSKLVENFKKHIQKSAGKEKARLGKNVRLGTQTNHILSQATKRAQLAIPSKAALRHKRIGVFAKTVAKKIRNGLMKKFLAKRATAAGAGAVAGTVLCSWAGFATGICSTIGGAIGGLGADLITIKLSEYFGREEFEAELSQAIDESRDNVKTDLEKHVEAMASDMESKAKQAIPKSTN